MAIRIISIVHLNSVSICVSSEEVLISKKSIAMSLTENDVISAFTDIDVSGDGCYVVGPLAPGLNYAQRSDCFTLRTGSLKKCSCYDARTSGDGGVYRVGMAEPNRGVGRRIHEHITHFQPIRKITDATSVWAVTKDPHNSPRKFNKGRRSKDVWEDVEKSIKKILKEKHSRGAGSALDNNFRRSQGWLCQRVWALDLLNCAAVE